MQTTPKGGEASGSTYFPGVTDRFLDAYYMMMTVVVSGN